MALRARPFLFIAIKISIASVPMSCAVVDRMVM